MADLFKPDNGSLKAWRNFLEQESSGTTGDGGFVAGLHFLNITFFAWISGLGSLQ
jgi:hypothetical protein